jgi:LacI family transcriptional regulator
MQPGLPTLDDVARLAGVSTATVSRCLNLPDQVRLETRRRIEAAVAELGYTPNLGARALASRRTNTIGAVIPTMENAIFARGVQVLEEQLSAKGITLLVATSHYDVAREADQIKVLLGRGVDGLILVGEARPPEIYHLLRARGVPFVLVWTYREGAEHSCVGFDNRAAARSMAEHVLAFGHRRIGMIAGITGWNDRASERVGGVRDALEARGVPLGPSNLIESPYSFAAGAEATRRLAALSPRPTAIICGNDVLAVGAIIALREMGLSVPDDISVVGFDDTDLATAVFPPLTTVHVPHRRMGLAAAELLHRLITEGSGGSIAFETKIVDRASLAAPPGSAREVGEG